MMRKPSKPRRGVSLAALGAGLAAGVAYGVWLRPWLLRWGAGKDESRQALPGDELVRQPNYQTTRAITIHAPANRVWPWLVQIGYQRGGFYSYDRLERIAGLVGLESTARITPEWQDVRVGDCVLISPITPLRVARLEPQRTLALHAVMHPWRGTVIDRHESAVFIEWSWAFVLEALDAQRTRLLVRVRADIQPAWLGQVYSALLLEPVHFAMERKMLLGVQNRAEARGTRLDELLPEYDFNEVHRVYVNAAPEDVFAAAKNLRPVEISPLLFAMLDLRGLPGRLLKRGGLPGGEPEQVERPSFLEQLYAGGFSDLGERPGEEVNFGLIGEFWKLDGGREVKVGNADEFRAFREAGLAKVAANLRAQPAGERTLLSTETRIWAPDEATRRKFAFYWQIISLGSGWIRLLWLNAIKRKAEEIEIPR